MHLPLDGENQMESLAMLLNRKHQVMEVGFQAKRMAKASWDFQRLPEAWRMAASKHLPVIPGWQ